MADVHIAEVVLRRDRRLERVLALVLVPRLDDAHGDIEPILQRLLGDVELVVHHIAGHFAVDDIVRRFEVVEVAGKDPEVVPSEILIPQPVVREGPGFGLGLGFRSFLSGRR